MKLLFAAATLPFFVAACTFDDAERHAQPNGADPSDAVVGLGAVQGSSEGPPVGPPDAPSIDGCAQRVEDACVTVTNAPGTCGWLSELACAEPPSIETCYDDVFTTCTRACWDATLCASIAELACGSEPPPPPPPATPIASCDARVTDACLAAHPDLDCAWVASSACDVTPPREARCEDDLARNLRWIFEPADAAALAADACAPPASNPCVEHGCADGLTCDWQLGCVESPTFCCGEGQCGEGRFCDFEQGGTCQPTP